MKKPSIRTALVATSVYVALCVSLYAAASLLSANSPDANIGAGLLSVVPALLVFVVSLLVSRKK